MEVSGQFHVSAALKLRRKKYRYPLDKRVSGPQRRSGHYEEEKNLSLSGIEAGFSTS
jgi:hypothetical protein